MTYAESIARLRDGEELSNAEIRAIVDGIVSNEMSDAQLGAFAMAVLWRGLSDENAVTLTKAMRDSGQVLQWDVDGAVVDKHSTGGVGDCVSLALAPILACAGLYVPMISGRGLGHTGGTLDKLESMSGFSTALPLEKMQSQLKSLGCVMAGQSAELAPADKRLYAIRDVTGTVPSIDLITASILSKKLAAGLDALVLDVKCGLGAFMKTRSRADALAGKLVQVANDADCQTTALITDMNIPLCAAAGNSLEVAEILRLLEGDLMDSRLYHVTKALCVEVMELVDIEDADLLVDKFVMNGEAMAKFEDMVAAQGGPRGVQAIRDDMSEAYLIEDYLAPEDMEFHGFDAYEVGMSVVGLGGGRQQMSDKIERDVGVSDIAEPGFVLKGDLLARIHANNEAKLEEAEARLDLAMIDVPVQSELILGGVR